MPHVPDFTDSEVSDIRAVLSGRYRKDVKIQLATCSIILDDESKQTVNCPTVFWYEGKTNFIVHKTGPSRFRAQFFYTPHHRYGTQADEYTKIEECVSALLQTRSKHERE